MMTQLHPRDPENRQQNRFSEKPVTTGWMGKRGLSANNAQFVFVDFWNWGKESSHIRILNKY